MRFLVRFLRRRGKVLPWKEVVNQEPRYGDLRIEECLDEPAEAPSANGATLGGWQGEGA